MVTETDITDITVVDLVESRSVRCPLLTTGPIELCMDCHLLPCLFPARESGGNYRPIVSVVSVAEA
jgi:hypothetical protein